MVNRYTFLELVLYSPVKLHMMTSELRFLFFNSTLLIVTSKISVYFLVLLKYLVAISFLFYI